MAGVTFTCQSQKWRFAGESPWMGSVRSLSTGQRTGISVPPFSMAQATEPAAAPKAVKPVRVYRARGITVSVFENRSTTDGKQAVYYKVSPQRVYRDGDEFKTTQSFGRDDLPVLSTLLLDAFRFIVNEEHPRDAEEIDE
jgi:hypothetical protein